MVATWIRAAPVRVVGRVPGEGGWTGVVQRTSGAGAVGRRPGLLIGMLTVTVAVAVAGCGSSTPSSTPTTATTAPGPTTTIPPSRGGTTTTVPSTTAPTTTSTTVPTTTTAVAGSAAPAQAYATQACRTWQSSASQDSAVGSGTIKEAAAQAETSAGLDPTWGTLASAMVFVASLPETGNSPTDVAKSNADLATIESQCSGLGVTISN
jgi:hypothetical protein